MPYYYDWKVSPTTNAVASLAAPPIDSKCMHVVRVPVGYYRLGTVLDCHIGTEVTERTVEGCVYAEPMEAFMNIKQLDNPINGSRINVHIRTN